MGGIPQRVVYDNLKPAVKKVLRKGRELTRGFAPLATHYAFEPCFARPGEWHDTGGVESCGRNIRLQLLTPVPRGETLDEVSERLLARLDANAQTKICRTRGPIADAGMQDIESAAPSSDELLAMVRARLASAMELLEPGSEETVLDESITGAGILGTCWR